VADQFDMSGENTPVGKTTAGNLQDRVPVPPGGTGPRASEMKDPHMTTFYKRPRFWFLTLVVTVALVLAHQIWAWEIERVEVMPGRFLVLIHRWGADLDEGQIVAPDDSYKGVMFEVLAEGRHFINPIFWSYEIHDMVRVPVGKCLVRTRKFGTDVPEARVAAGDILARENEANPIEGERGILSKVLTQGSYRINPYAYAWELVPAVEIRVDQVGVQTLMVGKDPSTLKPEERSGPYVVPPGYRGIQEQTLPPGTYYINPYAEMISPVEVRSHKAELTDIQFPSRDGFLLEPRVVVEYAVQATKAPEMIVRLSDDGTLHQLDGTASEQAENEVLQKVILPHIRGYARIEGSNFDARDFILSGIVGADGTTKVNAREALQSALLKKVKPKCAELGVDIRAVTLADMRPPVELAEQIAQRELARVELQKNQAKLGQYKAEQELVAKEALKQQAKEKVEAETRLVQAKTRADQMREVELSRLKQELDNAQLLLDAAQSEAAATLSKGKAEAAVINLTNEAEVAGLRTAVQGFSSVQNFAQYHIVTRLAPALGEIFASDGSDFAKIFADYFAAPKTAPPTVPIETPAPASTTASAATDKP
jgi:SPFH domain/Band 7 family protein